MVPGKNGPQKNGPRKIGPRETQKRKIVGWASSIVVSVWNVDMWSIYENPKLDKTQNSEANQKHGNKKSWGECRASWCVCGMFGCDQSMKTQNLTTNTKLGNKAKTGNKHRGASVEHRGVCVRNVRMWSIYENPKLDNKSSWTPLVFHSLVHM